MFETDKDVLDWYEKQPRALTTDFVDSIRWRDVSNFIRSQQDTLADVVLSDGHNE